MDYLKVFPPFDFLLLLLFRDLTHCYQYVDIYYSSYRFKVFYFGS